MPVPPRAFRLSATAFVFGLVALVAPGTAATADDAPIAWSVSPAGADGALDGRTRLELQLDPGSTVTDHVTIANASTGEQTFDVYGADAINTEDGGYDLLAAATPSTDAGTWISVDQPQVTIPALGSVTVAVTVTAPADATPGDHAAGVVVSPAQPQSNAEGVVVDTRVAVRVSVRVSGELTPALTVSDVRVGYTPSLVPFGSSDAQVTYTVRNTGNVMVLGAPRVRITGPFGIHLANVDADRTREVLPGQEFTVRTTLAGVEPSLVGTAVVDVTMAAAPGPQTEIPLVSSTARTTFAAVPWTGLGVLVLAGLGVWWLIRWRRSRRAEGEAMWAELVDHARGGQLPGTGTALAVGMALVGGLLVLGTLGAAPPAAAATPEPTPITSSQTKVKLSIPPAPTTATPTPTPTASTTPSGSATASGGTGGGAGGSTGTVTAPRGRGVTPSAEPTPEPSSTLADTGDQTPSPTPAPSSTVVPSADTVWHKPSGLSPAQWALVGVSGLAGAGALWFGVRALMLMRSRAVVS